MTDISHTPAHEMQLLDFEHLGCFTTRGEIVVADPRYVDSRFSGLRNGLLLLCHEIRVEPGRWEAFAIRSQEDGSTVDFLLACHEDELETRAPFGEVERIGVVAIDTGRVAMIDSGHRDTDTLEAATAVAAIEAGPRVVDELGPVAALPNAGLFPLYASSGATRRMLFVAFGQD
ncbi:MAG: hypothetical protein B7733_03840 [Myxococcales bacterium FL481]|nr:MAG: hypothetical protein B7733_03840 [Myxococcales bacterium FL481]